MSEAQTTARLFEMVRQSREQAEAATAELLYRVQQLRRHLETGKEETDERRNRA